MSFWDREVHIWRLNQASKAILEVDDPETELAVQNRKLVAKILIKGEANITSASLSANGDFLAVSTVTDIKVFHLRAKTVEEGDSLRISKIDLPSSFPSGARLVKFSPDNKWLCIIRPDSRILVARILTSSPIFTNHLPLTKLERIDRRIEKHITLGGLGTYDRTITQVEFSSDSRIIAVSDLAGYVDTFVLSGAEDLTLTPTTIIHNDAASSSSSSSSDSGSDIESDSENEKPQLIFGQHWSQNPSAMSIPKVPSTPTILSFRPATAPPTNGVTTHAIPTRQNPNPVSHDLPSGEDRLLVVTATLDIFEFEVLKGVLSPWSRRNPTSSFPEEFRKVLDQARGCIWDVNAGKERLWLYGVSYLWMFDLSRDFPARPVEAHGVNGLVENGTKGRKRKRHGKGGFSGAGSAIPDGELGTGISRTMRRIVQEEIDETEVIPLYNDDDAMDVDSESDTSLALGRLHRGGDEVSKHEANGEEQGRSYWRTFKYRPILGMGIIGEESGEGEGGLEVALVERPIWEADLGPRYYGDQEWENSGL